MIPDKLSELKRYDDRAREMLSADAAALSSARGGAQSVREIYRAPYLRYEAHIGRLVRPEQVVLEIGSGTGVHTAPLVGTGARVVATDISVNALRVTRYRVSDRVSAAAADMEELPFASASFDVVACAGSLSYGEPSAVDTEIRRVLKSDGIFVCVDSLRNNPIYTMKRWLDYMRGKRTKRTLAYMPSDERVTSIAAGFTTATVEYFGAASFAMPALAGLLGESRAARLSDVIDRRVRTRRSAFKFVLVGVRPRPASRPT
ncbi:MAG TPA: class I SAM-dependent methyltransferase [Gemmatimonadaceae bacterium]|nr:class I SAM-dependent methyltransferase [Gemmatimonadaceae bacterium]